MWKRVLFGSQSQRLIRRKHTKENPVSSKNFSLSSPIVWYNRKLETQPLTTKCLTSGLISGGGDLFCQFMVRQKKEEEKTSGNHPQEDTDKEPLVFRTNWTRTCHFTLLGSFFVAPVTHFWYGALVSRFPGTSMIPILKKLVLDQAYFAPLFIPAFMTNLFVLEGRTINEMKNKLQTEYPSTLLANWGIWIPAQIINFTFVPQKFMVLFSNVVAFVWNAYLSWKIHEQ